MNEKLKVYVVGDMKHYASFMSDYRLTDELKEADVVMFTGGEDVDPSLYKKQKMHLTYSNLDRDLKEKEIFHKVNNNQLCVGICRGLICGSR